MRIRPITSRRGMAAITAVLAATSVILGGSLGLTYYQGIVRTNDLQNQIVALQSADNQLRTAVSQNAFPNDTGHLYSFSGVFTLLPGSSWLFFGPNSSKNILEGGFTCSKTVVDASGAVLCSPALVHATVVVPQSGGTCMDYFDTTPSTGLFVNPNFSGLRASASVSGGSFGVFNDASEASGLTNGCESPVTATFSVVIQSPYLMSPLSTAGSV